MVKVEPKVKTQPARPVTTAARSSAPTRGVIGATNGGRPAPVQVPNGGYRAPVSNPSVRNDRDLSSMVSNAIKVLPAFYSGTASMDKARDFWELFEAHTNHLPGQSRLLVFRQRIKGSEAERWWNNSTIKTFASLKVRFHNLFLSRTADQLWERLQSSHRERGESVDVWGGRETELCDSLDYPNRKMRYQKFRRGLRNKRILTCLDSGPARDIPEACEWLLAKEMSRPIEEDDEFQDEKKKSSRGDASPASDPMVAVGALTEQMAAFMTQQQQWRQQMMQNH
ncbi:hypothetical protein PF005_g20298 [Phytophthora fragariae]|uniref:Retrotransposon gag domain-containing protein n=1 Tax=Phytophthora fragariae TaxID=53985 RepID=A0A6A3SGU6_9STRA|nr:hypothetical protein PF003_g30529 [Phytophthora fragariae]KAE8928606.1 hypothetical protein PF009_g21248 [Phytophthora fragariae]KAE8988608.1 hypothetical protein PF011_g19097 [Phytophthora fragariae]KAE9088299.1 hypothetical protein PF007_g20023 [Phytophthora fragariae]KAE9088681.1 hypothetical protein PF010_g19291 [Phytophthora fragariae]